jgi:hypothetical protein
MPDGLEYLVRPYQTPNAQGAIIIPSTPAGTRERATLTWGAAATMPQHTTTSDSVSVNCCNEQQNELDRVSETVTVPVTTDDPSVNGILFVARPTQLRLKKKSNDQNSACIPDVTYFSGATFSDGFEPQDDATTGCKIILTFKNVAP